MDNLISIREVADVLGLSRVQVFNLVRDRKIPAEKVGRNYVILKTDLDKYINEDWINKPVRRVVREHRETLIRLGDE